MAEERRETSRTVAALALASSGSAVATFLVARFGLEGTIVGAALTPIIVALVAELARRPARRLRPRRRVAAEPGAGRTVYRARPPGRFSLAAISWRRVLVTGLGAFALVVAVFTLVDLTVGNSVASDRDTTFFPADDGAPARTGPQEEEGPATGPTDTDPATDEVGTTATVTTPTETAPPPTTTPTTPTTTEPSP